LARKAAIMAISAQMRERLSGDDLDIDALLYDEVTGLPK